MQFRKDIQILRGLSVLLVVLFHLEIGGFASGFLGVDVFFVISGLSEIDPAMFRIYPVAKLFCALDCKLVGADNKPLYFDDWHLTLTGSALLRPVFEQTLADLYVKKIGAASQLPPALSLLR